MLFIRWLCGRPPCAPARPPRRRLAAPERLEERDVLSGLSFQFLIDDPNHQFDAFPLLRTDLNAVGQIYSSLLNGRGTVEVRVVPNNNIPRSEGSTVGVFPAGTSNGVAVYEPAALAEATTGVDPNGTGPEIELDFNTQSFLPQCWFDPSGAARTAPVPPGKTDFISVAVHEMLHGFGFQGYRAISGPGYGTLPAGYESSYDALTRFGTGANAGLLYFLGPRATAVYGGPVPLTSVGPSDPLTSQNFYHLGNPAGRPGANLLGDVMNGVVFSEGTRYTVSNLDLAILADMGWDVPGFPPPAAPVPPAPQAPPPAHGHRHPRQHGGRHRHALRRLAHRPPPPQVLFRLG